MLGEEYGVASHRRLPAVVWRCRKRETSADEILAMAADRLHALLGDVLPVVGREMKARAELRLCEPPKCILPSRLSLHTLFLPPFLTTFSYHLADLKVYRHIIPFLSLPEPTSRCQDT